MATEKLIIGAPDASEHLPYYTQYISRVSGGGVIAALRKQIQETAAFLNGVAEDRGNFRYAPGKWTVKDCVGHMVDTERIMSYRALRFSRGDTTPLPGFEQDDYIPNTPYARVPLADIVQEFAAVRQSTLWLFQNLDAEALSRRGMASIGEVSVRALAYIIAGHELHHMAILKERYLS